MTIMKASKLHLLIGVLSMVLPAQILAAELEEGIITGANGKPIYIADRISGLTPIIDGQLEDDCWQEGSWFGNFIQQQPNEGSQPSENTAMKILYDDENIYVAIHCFDSEPDKIERRLSRRDGWSGDVAGLAIDSYFDHRSAFEFALTAAGAKIDLLHLDDFKFDRNWDAVWYGKTSVNDSSWIAEMQIPFNQMRFPEKDEYVWGLHVYRWLHKNMEEDQFALIPRSAPAMVPLFGELRGIKGIKPRRRIELLPYARSNATVLNGGSGTGKIEYAYAGGMDAKLGFRGNYTIDITANPDFGQVEADPSVLNLTAFEVFYNEKRPFFVEGNSLFDFKLGNDRIFYSRRIGEKPRYKPWTDGGAYVKPPENTSILAAVKLIGKSRNGLAVGVLQAVTGEEQARILTGDIIQDRTVQPLTNFFISRVQQDLNNSNTIIGGIFTSNYRDIGDDHLKFLSSSAYTAGIDFKHQWHGKTYFLLLKAVGSTAEGSGEAISTMQTSPTHYYQRPDATHLGFDPGLTRLSGYGVEFEIGKGGFGRWRYSERINMRSPGFELNDLGYIKLADAIDQVSRVGYMVNDPGKVFRRYSVFIDQSNQWNYGGEHLKSSFKGEIQAQLNNLWGFQVTATRNRSSLDTRLLRGGPALYLPPDWQGSLYLYSDRRKKFAANFKSTVVTADDSSKRYLNLSPGASWHITSTFNIQTRLSLESNLDNQQYVSRLTVDGKDLYLLGELEQKSLGITFRFDYLLTPDLSVQYYVSPFVAVGKYSRYKRVESARASSAGMRFHTYEGDELLPVTDSNELQFDENLDGVADYSINNPNFKFGQLRSNFVIRWEYRPGSTVYLVWSQSRDMYESLQRYSLPDAFDRLGTVYHDDILLIKLSHWFSI